MGQSGRSSSKGGAHGDPVGPDVSDGAPCEVVSTRDPRAPATADAAGLRASVAGARAPSAGASDAVVEPSAAIDEARWVARLVARDEAAFNALVRTYQGRVFALIARMIGNHAEAEDLAQEVFVQVFKSIGSFRGESKLSTWIYRIAVNLTKNRGKYLTARHAGQQEPLEKLEAGAPLADAHRANVSPVARPDDVAAGKQLEHIVQEGILRLEPGFRECLVLRDVEDLSYEEIETITGLAEGTVKSRIYRARARLKEIIEAALGEKIT
jgi:RNA polymerase sigma-70 factor (ECF subfamily)